MGKPQSKRRTVLTVILSAIIVVCLAAAGLIIFQYYFQNKAYEDLAAEVTDDAGSGKSLADMHVNWDKLKKKCPDVIAWIKVPDTKINYPVVQGPDNEYYLHRSYDKTESWLSTGGTIFLDSDNKSDFSDACNTLYGHHMNDGSMFATLANWTSQSEFDSHRSIYVLTPTMNYKLRTFAVVLTQGEDAIVMQSFGSKKSQTAYIQDKMDRSVVSAGKKTPKAEAIDKVFMLATCEYSQNNGRACVFAYVQDQAVPSQK